MQGDKVPIEVKKNSGFILNENEKLTATIQNHSKFLPAEALNDIRQSVRLNVEVQDQIKKLIADLEKQSQNEPLDCIQIEATSARDAAGLSPYEYQQRLCSQFLVDIYNNLTFAQKLLSQDLTASPVATKSTTNIRELVEMINVRLDALFLLFDECLEKRKDREKQQARDDQQAQVHSIQLVQCKRALGEIEGKVQARQRTADEMCDRLVIEVCATLRRQLIYDEAMAKIVENQSSDNQIAFKKCDHFLDRFQHPEVRDLIRYQENCIKEDFMTKHTTEINIAKMMKDIAKMKEEVEKFVKVLNVNILRIAGTILNADQLSSIVDQVPNGKPATNALIQNVHSLFCFILGGLQAKIKKIWQNNKEMRDIEEKIHFACRNIEARKSEIALLENIYIGHDEAEMQKALLEKVKDDRNMREKTLTMISETWRQRRLEFCEKEKAANENIERQKSRIVALSKNIEHERSLMKELFEMNRKNPTSHCYDMCNRKMIENRIQALQDKLEIKQKIKKELMWKNASLQKNIARERARLVDVDNKKEEDAINGDGYQEELKNLLLEKENLESKHKTFSFMKVKLQKEINILKSKINEKKLSCSDLEMHLEKLKSTNEKHREFALLNEEVTNMVNEYFAKTEEYQNLEEKHSMKALEVEYFQIKPSSQPLLPPSPSQGETKFSADMKIEGKTENCEHIETSDNTSVNQDTINKSAKSLTSLSYQMIVNNTSPSQFMQNITKETAESGTLSEDVPFCSLYSTENSPARITVEAEAIFESKSETIKKENFKQNATCTDKSQEPCENIEQKLKDEITKLQSNINETEKINKVNNSDDEMSIRMGKTLETALATVKKFSSAKKMDEQEQTTNNNNGGENSSTASEISFTVSNEENGEIHKQYSPDNSEIMLKEESEKAISSSTFSSIEENIKNLNNIPQTSKEELLKWFKSFPKDETLQKDKKDKSFQQK
ncbi:Spindle pole body component [Trichinella spiralis]|uniref:Spindle pole body component n=1 Tax=Trichinella spiralis TaxID=6334 RepID=A0ABR3KF47_TRISP